MMWPIADEPANCKLHPKLSWTVVPAHKLLQWSDCIQLNDKQGSLLAATCH
jgi:hypothetical protein